MDRPVRCTCTSSASIRVCTTGSGAAKLQMGHCAASWRRRSTGTTSWSANSDSTSRTFTIATCSSKPLRRPRGHGAGRSTASTASRVLCRRLAFFACLSDFGAVHARRYAHDRAMTPVKFLDIVVELSLRSGIRGPFIETLEGILYDRVLYERQEAPPRSSELASFNAVEGRRILPDGRSAVSAPPTAAELLRLCCDVHKSPPHPQEARRDERDR